MQYVYNLDPLPVQNLDKSKLKKEIASVIDEFLKRYNEKYKEASPPTHATQGLGHTWVLLQTIEQAVKKYGTPPLIISVKPPWKLTFRMETSRELRREVCSPGNKYAGRT